jgi:hypothetical protein
MFRRVHVRSIALAIIFVFCQVSGMVCALPDMAVAEETATLQGESMACPMDGTNMCPPSLTSSPERKVKNNPVAEIDHALIPVGSPAIPAGRSIQTMNSLGSAYSIVPISIESSSVLRI